MKLVKNFVFAVLLVSAMAVRTSAGVQDTPGVASPPPSPPERAMSTSTEETGTLYGDSNAGDTSDYLFLEALAALLSVY